MIILHVVPYEPLPEAFRQFTNAEHLLPEEERARFHCGRTLGDALTRSAKSRIRDNGLSIVTARTAEGKPATVILDIAQREGVDLIVLGSRGLSHSKAMLLGSVSHTVANLAECSCVVVK